MRSFLWSKFWTGLVPVAAMAEALTVVSNSFLGAAPFLKVVTGVAIFAMSFALIGLATGMGARYPRFNAENITQVAGSYGGIAFMVLAVAFIVVEIALLAWPCSIYLWYRFRELPLPPSRQTLMGVCFLAALLLSALTFWMPMKQGVRALEELGG